MTIRIPAMNLALSIDVQRVQRSLVRFGRPSAEPAVGVAVLISALSIAVVLAQIAGVMS